MSRKIELNFIIHLVIFLFICFGLYKYFDYNILNEYYSMADNAKNIMIEEIDLTTDSLYKETANIEDSKLEIEEYRLNNYDSINKATYLVKYYAPAMLILFILLLVNIEHDIVRKIKFNTARKLLEKQGKISKDKFKNILQNETLYRLRKISLPKSLPIVYIALYLAKLIVEMQEGLLLTVIDNLIFMGTVIITVFGFRLAINLFRTNNSTLRIIVIATNLLIGFFYPQIFFIIGLFQSLVNVRIVFNVLK